MSKPQSLEEAWELVAEAGNPIVASTPDGQFVGLHTAARALALAVLEELDLPCCGATGEDDPAWCGNPACLQAADMRCRIEALGR